MSGPTHDDRERRALKLAHRMRAAFRKVNDETFGVMAHSAVVPAAVVAEWDAELAALTGRQVT